MPWAQRATKRIPPVTSVVKEYEFDDYSKGMDTYTSNDVLQENDKIFRLAQNGRKPTLSEYETRKGFDYHSAPVGETVDVQQTSTTGTADQSVSETTRVAKKITFTTTGRVTRLDVRLKNSAAATGTIIVELWSNSGGSPSALLSRSSIASSDIDSSYAYEISRHVGAPSVTATDYWVVVYVQATGSGSYKISSTTNASTGLTSSNSGASWSAASVDFNVKAYLSTDAPTKGLHRAYKSDGTAVTLLAAGTVLYSVDDVTGALTTVKSGLNASATNYRFVTVNDKVYYVNGYDGLRKWDFTTESQVVATNYTNIEVHKGLLFLVTSDDPNKVVFSNFADYETFTSTDFLYIPSPKTGDPVTALKSVNGYLFFWTRNNKYILFGADNATFSLDEAPDQKGTYSQETVTADQNFAYYLTDDGIRSTNGTQSALLSMTVYEDIRQLNNKESACLTVYKGRLYAWFEVEGNAYNSKCYVFNLNFGILESLDTAAYVTRAASAFNDDQLIVGSSLVGQAYFQEEDSNDYTNLGGDIDFLLLSHFRTYGSPARKKEIRYWKPRFTAQSGSYTVDCLYAYDLRDAQTVESSPNVQGEGSLWGDSGTVWGSFTWGSSAELQSDLSIPGEHRRIATGYKHYATRQPIRFLGETQVVQIRRLK